ncbi:hypothetical protein GGS23DRAFT_268945 [Durotheca rogersii]|uniref:uncharacterized protein n=1 Tax=Durotheca rogersii TaxID=419775 RepID=UPI00221F4111|nr:uncharacterized protein GGS23DRAFT_268945 [Durotheca rogersii]KAI5859754.1 hypothetical protein GGS23DRAFT_268945 [Durotheca rogersii]
MPCPPFPLRTFSHTRAHKCPRIPTTISILIYVHIRTYAHTDARAHAHTGRGRRTRWPWNPEWFKDWSSSAGHRSVVAVRPPSFETYMHLHVESNERPGEEKEKEGEIPPRLPCSLRDSAIMTHTHTQYTHTHTHTHTHTQYTHIYIRIIYTRTHTYFSARSSLLPLLRPAPLRPST